MTNTDSITNGYLEQWVAQKLDWDAIQEKLMAMGFTKSEIEGQETSYKKIRYKKRKTTGFILMGLGSFLGFISCVLTMTNIMPDWNDFLLYGLTSIAVGTAFYGMYLVFEG